MSDAVEISKGLYRLVGRTSVTMGFLPNAVPMFEEDNPLPALAEQEERELKQLLGENGSASASLGEPGQQAAAEAAAATESDDGTADELQVWEEGSSSEPREKPRYPRYAWIRGALPAPNPSDCYVVQFRNATEFILLAYIDRFGRVFATKAPHVAPPAHYPHLAFAKYAHQPEEQGEVGVVQTYDRHGRISYPAEYVCTNNRYVLRDSWFDFTAYDNAMVLDDALSRAFLAFVYRPRMLGTGMPERGLEMVRRILTEKDPLEGLEAIENEVLTAEEDPAMNPPALMRCLARWLAQAGLKEALGLAFGLRDPQLRGGFPTRYSKTIFVRPTEESVVSDRICWQIEGALNRYLLIKHKLGDQAATASVHAIAQAEEQLRTVDLLAQMKDALRPVDQEANQPAGEWGVRSGMARDIESLRVPYRFEAEFRADVSAGVVAFDLTAPDFAMMPASVVPGGAGAFSQDERQALALEYAQVLGALLAASAFYRGRRIQRVAVTAFPFALEGEPDPEKLYSVVFERASFCRCLALLEGASPNVAAFFAHAQGGSEEGFRVSDGLDLLEEQLSLIPGFEEESYTIEQSNAAAFTYALHSLDPLEPGISFDNQVFDLVKQLPSDKVRYMLPGQESRIMSDFAQSSLGCTTTAGLSVNHDARYRYVAEQIAEKVARASSSRECIALIRQTQAESDDPSVLEGCNRLMAALAQDQVDARDQNRVVGAFLGRDRFLEALMQSRAVGDEDPRRAQAILRAVVDEALDAGVYEDSETTVYRVFDSTTSRLVYNLACRGTLEIPGLDLSADRGKTVELAPDSFFYCLVDLVRLLGVEFTGADQVQRYGALAIRTAPTMAAGYRTVARGFMLSGDLSAARTYLSTALRLALHPSDIGMCYYQLGYVEWKSGRYKAAMACYCKSMSMLPDLRLQVFTELRQMLQERRLRLVEGDDVDAALTRAGIPVAPNSRVLDSLHMATAAIVDEGLFPSAQNVLSTELHYRPDDALSHVLRSLD